MNDLSVCCLFNSGFLADIYHRLQLGFVIRALSITLTFVARDFKRFLEKKNKEKKRKTKKRRENR